MSSVFTGPYTAGPGSVTLAFKVTVTNAAQRLGTLVTTLPTDSTGKFPKHIILQVPAAAANPVYVTADNTTAPVVGGPGLEISAGQSLRLDNELALIQDANVNALTAIQVIATGNTTMLVHFFF